MMTYDKFMGFKDSVVAGEKVAILRYKSEDSVPYCQCSRCGKPIKRIMYVVQSCATDCETFYLGAECIKHFE